MKKEFQLGLAFLLYSSIFHASLTDLNNIEYTNREGKTVLYDHQERIHEIIKFSIQRKNLHLVLGRGTKEIREKGEIKPYIPNKPFYDYSEPLGDENNIWVYASNWKEAQEYGKYPHLIFDFNNKAHLDSIPDDIFSSIVFDGSVTKFIDDPQTTFEELGKKIIDNGYLYILPNNLLPSEPDSKYPYRPATSEEYMKYYQKALSAVFNCTIEGGNYPIFLPLAKSQDNVLHLKCQKK